MRRILIIISITLIIISCEDKIVDPGDDVYYDLDSTVFMYCNINSSVFYGIHFESSYFEPDPIDNYELIVTDPAQNINLILKSRMMLDTILFSQSMAILNIDTSSYTLCPYEPYDLNITVLTDTLIIGDFYGKFINDNNISDTVNVANGYLKILPYSYLSVYLKANINNDIFEVTRGIEGFRRKDHFIAAIDTNYQDSLWASIWIHTGTLTNDFLGTYQFQPNHKNLRFTLEIIPKNRDIEKSYYGFSGYVTVNDIELYNAAYMGTRIEERISNMNFEVDVKNNNGEIINITNGHFSSSGF